ncbi:hypothetical protein P3X46_031297 [Hevea brasiliensis]|uniref:NAC domain-containing protein n=1 Tax=Hevea brasiliensis TaxID=3981 RepID=A0ABQ9KL64_HEVBR|nr:SUPPRESSOR OF GAMMA RESPONSE 1 [Hevea brasiliensis]KAJ9140679.1 hypothetical protein P3X46_031297 [Hevea brasiliensis]KAJ9140680.1 hypothetical protein P3X46_031297 [Hevea brasiliensis]
MAGPSWLVDGHRFARKIKSASNPEKVIWESNPSKACPNCHHAIDNSDVTQKWPGLPRGVKFDPTDQEIILHLLAKVGMGGLEPHPFIDEFIPTINKDDGICYTHPQNLPSVRLDGSVSHFFHRAIKAYNTGTRKRRKVQGDDFADVRWHKTGRTKPVILDGVQKGCKKIMVLYMSTVRGGKAEKTNWVMHQYHLGTGEDEREGEYVVSKIFYQQQQTNKGDKIEDGLHENIDIMITKVDPVTPKSVTPEPPRTERRCLDFDLGEQQTNKGDIVEDDLPENIDTKIAKVDPVTCKSVTPEPLHTQRRCLDFDLGEESTVINDYIDPCTQYSPKHVEVQTEPECEYPNSDDQFKTENLSEQMVDNNDTDIEQELNCWDSELQNLLDSQQIVEGLSLCDELLQSQSPNRYGNGNERANQKPRLSDYAQLGPEDLKKDLEECQNLVLGPANVELDTPSEFRLSQLEFGSQESFLSWGGGKAID